MSERKQKKESGSFPKARKITIAGLLGGIAILLGVTSLGFIPTPLGITLTIMHIPVIIGAIMEGPYVGLATGLIFVLPRLFIGPVAYLAYNTTKKYWTAAIAGTATNTLGVLGMILIKGYLPAKVVFTVALTNGLSEIALAVIIVQVLMRPLARLRS